MSHIAALDRALAIAGTKLTLRRSTTPDPTDLSDVPASVRAYLPEEITGGVNAGDLKIVVSPTGLDDADWKAAYSSTGGSSLAAPFDVETWLPKRGDQVIADKRLHTIEAVMPIRINGSIVRIEMQVR